MALKVIKSDEIMEVSNICLTIYSQPGLGKTSLAFTASRPLLLDFDKGAHRAADRGDVVPVEKWDDVANIEAGDLSDYDTIILDTVGKALDCLALDILAKEPRMGYGGALNQQGWGKLGVRFSAYLRKIKSFGKDVVLISHMDEKHDGDALKERLKIPGGSKDLVLVDSDVIARITISNRARHLILSPTETAFGKDPAGIGSMPLPNATDKAFPTCLAGVISTVKDRINSLSEEQVARKGEVDWFKETLPTITAPEDITDLIGRAKKAGRDVAKMLNDRATELGLEFDPASRSYVHPETPVEDLPEEDEEAA